MPSQKDSPRDERLPDSTADEAQPTISGKWAILTIVVLAVFAAAASWWYRYIATHAAARFWGPDAALLIRDAPRVDALVVESAETPTDPDSMKIKGRMRIGDRFWRVARTRDVSHAPGLTHLRNALLDDENFDWTAAGPPDGAAWTHGLAFQSGTTGQVVRVFFTPDYRWAFLWDAEEGRPDDSRYISTAPIADGLAQMFKEFAPGGDQPR